MTDHVPSTGDRRQRADPPTWAPVPDPTTLTFALVDREIGHVKELVDLQFTLIERQRVESKADTGQALAAALTAQEKAAQVLATFWSDQLKALSSTFTISFEQLQEGLQELKDTTKTITGSAAGSNTTRQFAVALVGLVFGLLGTAAAVIIAVTR